MKPKLRIKKQWNWRRFRFQHAIFIDYGIRMRWIKDNESISELKDILWLLEKTSILKEANLEGPKATGGDNRPSAS